MQYFIEKKNSLEVNINRQQRLMEATATHLDGKEQKPIFLTELKLEFSKNSQQLKNILCSIFFVFEIVLL